MSEKRTRLLLGSFKIAALLLAFSWFQGEIRSTRVEADASTHGLRLAHDRVQTRITDLERTRETSLSTLIDTIDRLEVFQEGIVASDLRFEEDRVAIFSEIESRATELRELLDDQITSTRDEVNSVSENISGRLTSIEKKITSSSERKKRSMVYPVVQLRGNGTVGSGVVIWSRSPEVGAPAETLLLTAHHVFLEVSDPGKDDGTISDIRFLDPQTDRLLESACEGTLVAFYESADLALVRLELDEPWPYLATIAHEEESLSLQVFDKVYAVGCPLGNKPLPSVGEISSQEKIVAGQSFWMVNAPTFFGNSGGGIFNLETEKLVGISSMIYTYGKRQPMVVPHMGLFVPMTLVRPWLRREGFAFLLGEEIQRGSGLARDGEAAPVPSGSGESH
ncbi:MAG TPA: serine protease [Planctomycetes bacterium]|nr:serine protease [Planctomycetota bacterium]